LRILYVTEFKYAETHINVNVEFGEGEGKIPVGKIVDKAGEK
jgi:23S rRNA (uracil1939-C5)-methyltransferase